MFVCPPFADQTIHLRLYAEGPSGARAGKQVFTVRLRGRQQPDDGAAFPAAAFTYLPTGDGQTVTFTDSSSDPAGTIVSWSWDFGDPDSADNASTEQNPTHVFSAPGRSYTVTLTVTDDQGNSAADVQDVAP